jgi:hypothetical protein
MSLQTSSDSDDSPVRIVDFQIPEEPVIISKLKVNNLPINMTVTQEVV